MVKSELKGLWDRSAISNLDYLRQEQCFGQLLLIQITTLPSSCISHIPQWPLVWKQEAMIPA